MSRPCGHGTAGHCAVCFDDARRPEPEFGQADAISRLWRAVADAEAEGLRVPCREESSEDWTSDDPHAAMRAARACADCPVLALCADYVARHPEPAGTWGAQSAYARRRLARDGRGEAESQ